MEAQDSNIQPELLSLRTKLTVEIENDTKQIEHLKKRVAKNEALLQAVKGSLGAMQITPTGTGYGSKADLVREAINRIPKIKFIQDDVEAELTRMNAPLVINRNRIRTAIWTMAEKGEFKISRKGTNQAPAEYEKTSEILRSKKASDAGSLELIIK